MDDDQKVTSDPAGKSDEAGFNEEMPDVEFMRRRMLLRGAVSAVPVVMTLRSSPALASTGNQAVVQLTPHYDKSTPNIGGGKGAWRFEPEGKQPWLGPANDRVTCVSVDGNDVPTGITGYFDTTEKKFAKANANCGGIIIAASSGGSFTR